MRTIVSYTEPRPTEPQLAEAKVIVWAVESDDPDDQAFAGLFKMQAFYPPDYFGNTHVVIATPVGTQHQFLKKARDEKDDSHPTAPETDLGTNFGTDFSTVFVLFARAVEHVHLNGPTICTACFCPANDHQTPGPCPGGTFRACPLHTPVTQENPRPWEGLWKKSDWAASDDDNEEEQEVAAKTTEEAFEQPQTPTEPTERTAKMMRMLDVEERASKWTHAKLVLEQHGIDLEQLVEACREADKETPSLESVEFNRVERVVETLNSLEPAKAADVPEAYTPTDTPTDPEYLTNWKKTEAIRGRTEKRAWRARQAGYAAYKLADAATPPKGETLAERGRRLGFAYIEAYDAADHDEPEPAVVAPAPEAVPEAAAPVKVTDDHQIINGVGESKITAMGTNEVSMRVNETMLAPKPSVEDTQPIRRLSWWKRLGRFFDRHL